MMPSIREILKAQITSLGGDGLSFPFLECGCGLDDFAPCGCLDIDGCEVAKRRADGLRYVMEEKGMAEFFDINKARDAAKFDDREALRLFPVALDEIERLRIALIEERAQKVYPFSIPQWENVPEDDCVADHPLFGKSKQTGKKTYRWHAREQLRAEGLL